jgi:hypothetical protein
MKIYDLENKYIIAFLFVVSIIFGTLTGYWGEKYIINSQSNELSASFIEDIVQMESQINKQSEIIDILNKKIYELNNNFVDIIEDNRFLLEIINEKMEETQNCTFSSEADLVDSDSSSLGKIYSVSWENMREYIFEYDCMSDTTSPDPEVPDGMRILEVMTMITYRNKVYAVVAPIGEIWSFDGKEWNLEFIWNIEPHSSYFWRGGAWSSVLNNDKLFFFGYIMKQNGITNGYAIKFDGENWIYKECLNVSEFYSAEVYQKKIYCAGMIGEDAYIFNLDPDSLEFTLAHIAYGVGVPTFMSSNKWDGKLYVATGSWEHSVRLHYSDDIYANLLIYDGENWISYGYPLEEGFESVSVDGSLGVLVGASSGKIFRYSKGRFTEVHDLGGIHPIKMYGSGGNLGKDWNFDCLWISGGSRESFKPIGGEIIVYRDGEWIKLIETISVGFSDVETYGSWIIISTVWPRDHTRVSVLVFPLTYFDKI